MVVKNGDESHGRIPLKKSPTKQTKEQDILWPPAKLWQIKSWSR